MNNEFFSIFIDKKCHLRYDKNILKIFYAKTDLSAKKTETCTDAWLSSAHEDKDRAECTQAKKAKRKEKTYCFLSDVPLSVSSLKKEGLRHGF